LIPPACARRASSGTTSAAFAHRPIEIACFLAQASEIIASASSRLAACRSR
jgi:hypothetical protein